MKATVDVRARLATILVASLLPLGAAAAPSCTVRASGALAFGTYDTVNSLSGATTIRVRCARINQGAGGAVSYSISLSAGAGSYAARQLKSGANVLRYNLYADPAHTIVWGDGTGGTVTVSGSFTSPPNIQNATSTVYGLIPGAQNVAPGTYASPSRITITLNY